MHIVKSSIWMAAILVFAATLSGQDETLQELVRVTNVEVIVRVQKDGDPVAGLSREAFRLYEDGRPVPINGFFENRKRIGQAVEPQKSKIIGPLRNRLFVIYFWVYEKEVDIRRILDTFFRDVYHDGDRVLLVTYWGTIDIRRPGEIAAACMQMTAGLEKFAEQSRRYFARKIGILAASAAADESMPFFQRSPFMSINSRELLDFADSLRKIDAEKWVLIFYQRDINFFANLAETDFQKTSNNMWAGRDALNAEGFETMLQNEMQRHRPSVMANMKVIQEAFIKAGASCSLAVLGSKSKNKLSPSMLVRLEELQCGWQDIFASMSKATGGNVLADIEPTAALAEFSSREDISYQLSYEPANGREGIRKLRVDVAGGDYALFYIRTIDLKKLNALRISGLSWREPFLEFRVDNYHVEPGGEGFKGRMSLIVRSEGEPRLKFMREIDLPVANATVSMKLRLPKLGKYALVVDAVDLLSGRRASEKIKIASSGVQPDC